MTYHELMMADDDLLQNRLDQLRQWRNVKPEPDLSLAYVRDDFKKRVERPYKQLALIVPLWEQLVPENLVKHSHLVRLDRGVLHVQVDSSARLYELDRLLRTGLEQRLIVNHRGPAFRRVKLRLGRIDGGSHHQA